MSNPLHHGLNKQLRRVADKFDALCRDHNLQYTIESDTHNEQGYLIHGKDIDNASVKIHMDEFIQNQWVNMAVEDNKHGKYFTFTVRSLFEYPEEWNVQILAADKINENLPNLENIDSNKWIDALVNDEYIPPVITNNNGIINLDVFKAFIDHGIDQIPTVSEDQYKPANNKLKRSQAPFSGSSNGPAKTFGGESTQSSGKKKKKKVSEDLNVVYELARPLLAHDNITIVPKGSKIQIVDDDPELPDVKLEDGRILNVDRSELQACIKEDLDNRLDRLISENMAVIRIAPPDIMQTMGGFASEVGNMEADFESPSDPMSMRINSAFDNIANELGVSMGNQPNPIADSLNKLRATEIVSALQYELFATTVGSLNMGALQDIFWKHRKDELRHAKQLAQRIHEIGGEPIAKLEEIARSSAYQIDHSRDPQGMVVILKEQEAIAVKSYRATISQCHDDPATRNLLEEILREEEEHLSDMDSMIN